MGGAEIKELKNCAEFMVVDAFVGRGVSSFDPETSNFQNNENNRV